VDAISYPLWICTIIPSNGSFYTGFATGHALVKFEGLDSQSEVPQTRRI
jgi:hypothetical protein